MATAHFASMGNTPNMFKSEFDMDSFIDFNATANTNTPRTSSRSSTRAGPSRPTPQVYNTAPSPIEESDENQIFAGPSHEYDRFKQQVPVGTVASFSHINQPMGNSFGNDQMMSGFNSGIDEMSFGFDNFGGIDMDTEFGPSQPAMFFAPGQTNPQANNFVDPNSIDAADEEISTVGRLWPGMHQQQAQQAALAKAQHQNQSKAAGKARATSHQSDPHTEESISRLLNQMRQGNGMSGMGGDDLGMHDGSHSHAARMRKEEEDMDEDERLLASEEGKKLSSKERRQLRNKVSARAFRSRRKEYIGQLEGEVAVKQQECTTLKTENQGLLEENARYRALIQTLLRHPSFGPVLDEMSKDPNFLNSQPQQQAQRRPSVAPTPAPSATVPSQQQEAKPFQDFERSRQLPKHEVQHVGMTMVPEVDISMLNINNNNSNYAMSRGMNFNFQQPSVYSLHDVPQGPSVLDAAVHSVSLSRQNQANPNFARLPSNASSNFSRSRANSTFEDQDYTSFSAGSFA